MREQVITPRGTGRSSSQASAASRGRAGGMVQRPARRERGVQGRVREGFGLRGLVGYLPVIGKVLLAVALGLLIFAGYRAAASASFFQARTLDVSGASHANADEIKAVLRRQLNQTGIWRADLAELSAQLERLPWVRTAIVSRVLPDGLRVRIVEREPRAIVRTSAGRFIWVDDDAVSLGAMSPSDRMPAFFIRGWDESNNEAARALNRERLKKYFELSREWETAGLSRRVSEINLEDPKDVRVQLSGDDSQIEVRFLGETEIGKRLGIALRALDQQRDTPCGSHIQYLQVKADNATVIGYPPEMMKTCVGTPANRDNASTSAEPTRTGGASHAEQESTTKKKRDNERNAQTEREPRAKRDKKKENTAVEAKSQTRPRRVG